MRKPIEYIKDKPENEIMNEFGDSYIVANPPSNAIYDFKGQFVYKNHEGAEIKEGLSLENTAWANTVMAS